MDQISHEYQILSKRNLQQTLIKIAQPITTTNIKHQSNPTLQQHTNSKHQ